MTKKKINFLVQGDFIHGQFCRPVEANGEWINRSPADFSDELGEFQYSYCRVEEAVHSARLALSSWRLCSLAERIDFLKKYQNVLKRYESQWVEAISREVGKPLWESKTEFSSILNQMDIAILESVQFVKDFEVSDEMPNRRAICRYKPLGVVAVIGPFSFPGSIPHGHIIPALLTGNTVVFKPSEKTPLVGQMMASCFQEAGFPPGVFNLIQGEKEMGRRLCIHDKVDAILFTGSYEVGIRIKQDTLQQHWKLLGLTMGGKNSAIVWEDAQIDATVQEVLQGSFLTAGQRCTSTSRVLVHQKILDEFTRRFHQKAKAFSIGHPFDNPFMGPLIDQGSVDRYMKFLGIASREGFELIMRGKSLSLSYSGNYVTPSICFSRETSVEQVRKSIYQQTELFAPNVAIIGVTELEEAIGQANATQYGLIASVFSQNQSIYEKCLHELEVGLVNWNQSTLNVSPHLPFGGLKKSGNHFITGLSGTLSCSYPVSSLEVKGANFAQLREEFKLQSGEQVKK